MTVGERLPRLLRRLAMTGRVLAFGLTCTVFVFLLFRGQVLLHCAQDIMRLRARFRVRGGTCRVRFVECLSVTVRSRARNVQQSRVGL